MLWKKGLSKPPMLTLGLLALASTNKSQAGSPEFWLEYTNLTSNADSDQASKECANAVKKRLGATFNKIHDVDQAERRQRAKSKGDAADFMSWGAKDIQVRDDFTFVVAVDCRPSARQFDALLVGRKGSIAFHLRSVPLSVQRLSWLADDIANRAEAMFWR